jgi:hypothetical protein
LQTISIIADSSLHVECSKLLDRAYIENALVGQERTGKAQLLRYGSKHLGQNFFFYFIVLDRFFPEEPSLPRTGYFNGVFPSQPFSTRNG